MRRHRGFAPRVAYATAAVTLFLGVLALPATAQTPGDQPWMDTSRSPEERAELLIDALTLEQKFQQIVIIPIDESETLEGCNPERTARTIEGIPELSIPTFRMTNGGTGMRGGSCLPVPDATAMPSTNLGAATFEPELNYVWGEVLGDEARHWAHQVMLAPGLNLHRHPYGGRIHEYFSEDPYLTGVLASEQIKGIQSQGIHADPKHFVGNEQERERWTAASWIPSRAMHELYLLPFEMAVRDADVASIMCAYPHVNFQYNCDSQPLLQQTDQVQECAFAGAAWSDQCNDLARLDLEVCTLYSLDA